MLSVIVLAFSGVVCYLLYTRRYSAVMMQIGLYAAEAFVFSGSEEALMAAMAVRAGMSKKHAQELIGLTTMFAIDSADEADYRLLCEQRKRTLMESLIMTDDSVRSAADLRQRLSATQSLWLTCILKCDKDLAAKQCKMAHEQGVLSRLDHAIKNDVTNYNNV